MEVKSKMANPKEETGTRGREKGKDYIKAYWEKRGKKGVTGGEDGNETKEQKFSRLASQRTTTVVKAIGALKHLSNRSSYAYTEEQIEGMVANLTEAVEQVRSKFSSEPKTEQKEIVI